MTAQVIDSCQFILHNLVPVRIYIYLWDKIGLFCDVIDSHNYTLLSHNLGFQNSEPDLS